MEEDLSKLIGQFREDFMKGSLSEEEVLKQPDEQFSRWMHEAIESKVMEVQAFNLCTVSSDNKPSNRIVYLREFGNNLFYFYTNFESRKAINIQQNNNVSACFFYPELERQIRIEGKVYKAEEQKSDDYFDKRPRESQIGAWSSPQSKKINNRQVLEQSIQEHTKKFNNQSVNRPPFWGGYVIKANYYEFWQGRKSRLHDRICYELINDNWTIYRIAP